MKNKEVTADTWKPGPFQVDIKGGISVFIGADMSVSISVSSDLVQGSLCFTKIIFDQIIDAYSGWVKDRLWEGTENKHVLVPSSTGEWQFAVSHATYISPKRSQKNQSILIRHSHPKWSNGDQTVVFFIKRKAFDQIVKWYNSEVE